MLDTQNKIESSLRLIDNSFSDNYSNYYDLLIYLNKDCLSYAVYDHTETMFLALETYDYNNIHNDHIFKNTLNELFQINKTFQLKYNAVKIAFGDCKSTFIPLSLYDETKTKTYLSFNYKIKDDYTVRTDNILSLNAKNIYAVPKEVLSLIGKYFSRANIYHSATPLIEAILYQNQYTNGKQVFAHVQPSYVEIAVINNNKVIFYNSFQYRTVEDFTYFIMYVYEQLGLNSENISLTFLGEIYSESALLEAIYQYVRNIGFSILPDNLLFSPVFNELEAHLFYNLFSLNLCE